MDKDLETGGDDLRATLEAAFDEHEVAPTERDDSGGTEPDNETPVTPVTTAEPEVQAAPAEPELQPPTSWKEEYKAQWAQLPAWAKQEVLRREADFNKGIQEKGQEANFAKAIKERLAPHRDKYLQQGMDDTKAVDFLVNMHEFFERDPAGYLQHVAQAAGINLSALAQQPPQQVNQGYIDPQVNALQRELAAIKQSLTAKEQNELQQQIETFKADKPHFEEVRPLMATLIQSGQAPDLQTAYDMATYASPTTRQRILEDQRRAELERKAAEDKAKVTKAKQAAVSVRGAPGGAVHTQAASPETVRDALQAAWAEHEGRVN